MFNSLHEGEQLQDAANPAGHGATEDQFFTDEQFPVISAYIESLPGGLIGDEI